MVIILVFLIDIIIEDDKIYNSKIAVEHLLNMNENLMFEDVTYDINILRTITKNNNIHNPRNSKKQKTKKQDIFFINKLMLKDRIIKVCIYNG